MCGYVTLGGVASALGPAFEGDNEDVITDIISPDGISALLAFFSLSFTSNVLCSGGS